VSGFCLACGGRTFRGVCAARVRHTRIVYPPEIEGTLSEWVEWTWSYEGIRAPATQWDVHGDKRMYRTYVQGALYNCPPPKIWCIQRIYPQLWLDIRGNGVLTGRTAA
jgi:hypothetical protein